MKIISISIYSREYELVFHKTIEKSLNEDRMEIISAFLNGVNQFGKETFSEDLRRVDMNGVWLDFLHIENYVIVMVIEIDLNYTEEENIVYDSVIEQIEEFIHGMLLDQSFSLETPDDMEFFSEFIEMKLQALQLGKINIPSNIKLGSTDWSLDMAMVCESNGILIHDKKYSHRNLDPYLISMMLSTFQSFARIEFNFTLKKIHIGKQKLCVESSGDKIFTLIVSIGETNVKSMSTKTRNLIDRILYSILSAVEQKLIEIQDEELFYSILDEYSIN
ncbi:MAG: hypothetical protein INQ03_16735 [Candidatus Heimdallarchaeota archaeon]|nr:hypothetical protein [Candidatus Heimdallarchaeota archaeon]